MDNTRHRFVHSIHLSLITLLIASFNVQLARCLDNVIVSDGSIPVFKFKNLVQNIVNHTDDRLLIAGLNSVYLLKDEYSSISSNYRYLKKSFFTEPKNQHLSTSEYRNESLRLISSASTISDKRNDTFNEVLTTVDQVQNYNKILIQLTKTPATFLVCGTAYYGRCLLVIINTDKVIPKDVFTDERFDSIASRKSSLMIPNYKKGNFLLAHEPDNRPDERRPPIVSRITMEQKKNQTTNQNQYSFRPIAHGRQAAMININDKKTLDNTRMHFIYGFLYERYGFILKIEQKEGQSTPITRLGRVCLDDNSFFSYSEIQLNCKNDSIYYSYASTAHFGRADSYLSRKSDVKLKNDTLFISMNVYDARVRSIDRTKGSMLCAYTIEQIVEHFSYAIESCYAGKSNPGIATMIQYSSISKSNNGCTHVNKDNDYMCQGNSLNSYVEYRLDLMGVPLYQFDHNIITSLATTILKFEETELNTFVLGSDRGELFKLARAFDEQLRLLHTFKLSANQTHNSPINPNPLISSQMNAYFTSGDRLIKYPMSSCSIYSTCKQCFTAVDNLKCGWCSVENQNAGGCMNEGECSTLGKDENFKTTFLSDNCVPIIENFTPQNGPLGGNTLIEIKGENLCNPERFGQSNNYKVDITIGKQNCRLENCTETGLACLTSEFKTASHNSNDAIKVCTEDKGVRDYTVDGCTVSLQKFNYTQPDVSSIEPTYGPIGGGTIVKLEGKNLNVGRYRYVHIKAVECVELRSNYSYLECMIQGREWREGENDQLDMINQNGELLLEIDGNKYRLDQRDRPDIKFEFKPNPTIVKYHPKAGLRNSATNVTIVGRHFASAHKLQAKITVYSIAKGSHIQLLGKCTMNNSTLNCFLPAIPDEIEISSARSPLLAKISLVPDGDIAKSTHIESNSFDFYYYPLPRYKSNFTFKDNALINSKKQSIIELKGENLSDQYNFVIKLLKLENESANVTSPDNMKLSGKQLICSNPEQVKGWNSLIRCTVDLSAESIDSLLDTLWLVRVELPNKDPFNVKLIRFKLDDLISTGWSKFWKFIFALFSVVILIALVGSIYLYRQNRLHFSKKKKFPHFNVTYSSNSPEHGQTMMDSPFIRQSSQNGLQLKDSKLFDSDQYKIRLAQDNILIPWDCIKVIESVGQGYYGCVFKGELKVPSKAPLTVAIKTLKNAGAQNSEAYQMLIDEAFRMKDFKHDNVLTLIGVCLKEDSIPMIVLPFMKNGDLLTYIRSESNSPTVEDLLYFGIDVAKGMAYLSAIRYIHRDLYDLAARNCMMDENLRIKVADFGLTRDVYEKNYYHSANHKEIPIKWMAPESVEKSVATIESDAWSYGILLWELMTRGNIPYAGFDGYGVIKYLKSQRLPKPESCPDSIYELMLDCWQLSPKMRPTFDSIVQRIETIIKEAEEDLDVYSNLNVLYTNYPIEQYYSNNIKKLDALNETNSTYCNSSVSIASPSSSTYNMINGIVTTDYPKSKNSTANVGYPMSTFKSQSSSKIEMPGQEIVVNNDLNRESIYNNDEAIKLCTSSSQSSTLRAGDQISLQSSRKNSSSDNSTKSTSALNLNTKLNRQNAIDLNEADNRTYEYVMQTPHMLVDRKSNKGSSTNNDDQLDDETVSSEKTTTNILDSTNYVQPMKYFR